MRTFLKKFRGICFKWNLLNSSRTFSIPDTNSLLLEIFFHRLRSFYIVYKFGRQILLLRTHSKFVLYLVSNFHYVVDT